MPRPCKHMWKVWVNRPEPEPGRRWPRKSYIYIWCDSAEELPAKIAHAFPGFTVRHYVIADEEHEEHVRKYGSA